MTDSETVHLQLTVDGIAIEAAVALPPRPAPRRMLLPTLQGLADTIVRIAENAATLAEESVSCKKGCDACCRQMVPISAAEAHGIAALMDALPPAAASKVLERFDQALETLEQKGLFEWIEQRGTLSQEAIKQLDRDYFAAGIACPFLVNRACSIHAARPLACREFLVSSPAHYCRNPEADTVRQIPMPAKVSVALAAQEDESWLPLVLARQFVSSHPEKTPSEKPAVLLDAILRAL